jgi:hypothetical protein
VRSVGVSYDIAALAIAVNNGMAGRNSAVTGGWDDMGEYVAENETRLEYVGEWWRNI